MYRILVVDDDHTSLFVANACLKSCNYEVTAVNHPLHALSILDQKDHNEKPYDMVLSDVHMPDMDGFELMRRVHTQFNIPVIMISADDRTEVIRKGYASGAPAYLLKPIQAHHAKLMWQYSVSWKNAEKYACRRFIQANIPRSIGSSSSGAADAGDRPRERKTKKIDWNSNLHSRFVEAMLILGPNHSVPKKILEVMNVGSSLTREQVASHMQKFGKFLDKVLDGATSLDETTNRWIDCSYYSSIVGGNPNKILIQQLQEKRRTGKLTAPIQASLPLPPFNEAEASSSRNMMNITMLMPNNYASSRVNVTPTVPGLSEVAFQSPVNVDTPAQELGGVSQLNNYFTNGGVIGGTTSNMFPSTNPSAPSSATAAIFNNFISQQQLFNAGLQGNNTFFSEDNLNAHPQVGNVQLHDPNLGGQIDANEFGNTLGMNQQELGSIQLDQNIGNSFAAFEFGNAMPMLMNEQALELGDQVQMADGSRFGNPFEDYGNDFEDYFVMF